MKSLNKDTQNIDELSKNYGLDQSEQLLQEKEAAPYDEVKLRETTRKNEDLKHKITQAVKDNDDYSDRLIQLQAKNTDLSNQVKIFENHKKVNEQLKQDLTEQQEDLRIATRDEAKLREQNEYLDSLIKSKKAILLQKQDESQQLVDLVDLATKLIDMHTLNNNVEESVRVLNDKARSFRNEVKSYTT